MSSGSARAVPGADGAQTGQPLDETSADLALRATRYLRTRFRERVTIETCHEVGYTSVGTFSRRFLRDVGTPPGALRRIADRVAERTQPPVSLLVPAVARIRIRPEVPEEMRRTLGPAPYQWIGTFPRPVPSGLPATGTLRRGIDEVELRALPRSPWLLATIFPDGADVHEQLAPTRPLVARLRVPEEPVVGPVTLPVRAALPWDPAVLVALAAMVV